SGAAHYPLPQGLGGRGQAWWLFRPRRLSGKDPNAGTRRRSRWAAGSGPAVFWLLALAPWRLGSFRGSRYPGAMPTLWRATLRNFQVRQRVDHAARLYASACDTVAVRAACRTSAERNQSGSNTVEPTS